MDTGVFFEADVGPGHARAFATATGEPSSARLPTQGPPPLPRTWRARTPGGAEVMRPTARAGPGTSRGGGHRQSKGKARGAGRRGT